MANKRGNAGQPLPLSDRDDDHMQGHWLLARLGKRVLRPGGVELTRTLLARAEVTDADVLEAPPAGADTEETIDHLVAVLDDLGFAPERRASNGRQQVGLRHCPFLELAETQAGVVCPVHLGIMRGALQTWGAPVTVDRLDAFVEPDLCLAHFTPLEGAIR